MLEVVATLFVLCGPAGAAGLEAELRGYQFVSGGLDKGGRKVQAYVTYKDDGALFPLAFTYEIQPGRQCLIVEDKSK